MSEAPRVVIERCWWNNVGIHLTGGWDWVYDRWLDVRRALGVPAWWDRWR